MKKIDNVRDNWKGKTSCLRQQKILGQKGSILLGNKRPEAFRLKEQVQVYLAVPDDRPLKDTVHAEDGGLGRVDDGSPKQ